MADGRFINKKISEDERVAQLPVAAQLLYERMILHLDVEGRITGNPSIIKQKVIPLIEVNYRTVDNWLDKMATLRKNGKGLIERYDSDGMKYIWMPGFEGEQRGLRKDREKPSVIPPPPNLPSIIPEPENGVEFIPLDPKFAGVVKCYEEHIGLINSAIKDRLEEMSDTYPEGWFQDATAEAVQYNARSLNYIEKILKRWQAQGKGGVPKPETEVPENEYEMASDQ